MKLLFQINSNESTSYHDKNVSQLQSFLGLVGYYRKFIPNFADISNCLYKLTSSKVLFGQVNTTNPLNSSRKLYVLTQSYITQIKTYLLLLELTPHPMQLVLPFFKMILYKWI